jgi:two-component system, NarL family, nitrate/nitrite response regulator NarL
MREQEFSSNITAAVSSIRVFLLIENRLLRESLVRLFRNRSDLTVVGQSGQADLSVQQVLDSDCDVLVVASFLGNYLPASITLDRIGQLGFKVVLIGMDCDEEQFLATIRAGVTGYLLKDASASDMLNAVRSVFRGEAICPPQLCSTLFRFVAQMARERPQQTTSPKPYLTLRQQQLVTLVAKGLTNKEIASRLNLSQFTVRNHVHRILKEVGAGSRSEAVDAIRACGFPIAL